MSAEPSRNGRFVCVVGPSGAGKDTLINLARERLARDPRFVFVRRLITRPPYAGEDHEPISETQFEEAERRSALAISWRAHGLCYGVPDSVRTVVASGAVVVCNMSRAAIPDARRLFPTSLALVTAPPEILAERIAARGRESVADALARLRRKVQSPPDTAYDLVIENVTTPERGAADLEAFLRPLAGEHRGRRNG
ncbi:phosphonate metabolism protein/1,5-bisphosphokinase (PRPP-forming) PhnN [Hansschlegelia quercus]|uniref:Ribose 1,5-bisphosphate phosphokinase PhnN n=1 Tax=Hansschlegelia quercus TaxID=2528245 RepID=A0A4Q9GIU4_9HYPH|nr:phosphonate metabolism protein/1,5-bisphosphokinase (PRPP-forming) PhnN [Hansschlegelia quercus]